MYLVLFLSVLVVSHAALSSLCIIYVIFALWVIEDVWGRAEREFAALLGTWEDPKR
jgi:hypothetical protein